MNLLAASKATCWGQAQLGHLAVQEPQVVEGVKPASYSFVCKGQIAGAQ